ncbi:MAG: methenyltetrahydromethanopterin cyclohydrolase [Desulfurococcaceae archaeon]
MSRSMNKMAVDLVMRVIELRRELRISSTKVGGATVIDMGVKAPGGFEAGLWLSKICMGGLGQVSLTSFHIGDILTPAVTVYTDHPLEACMASQYAGWRIKVGEYFAMGSGPARALAKKPKGLYDEIAYSEESDEAVIALEADKCPSEEVIKYISDSTNVSPGNLYVVVAPTNSVAGSVQVSARIVETGIHKFHSIGFDIKTIKYGFGMAPVAPLHPNPLVMMGRTNDMLLYGGSTFYIVDYPDELKLKDFVEQAPSVASKDYGRSLAEVVMEVGAEFLYKIDPKVFAPAVVEVNSVKSGLTYRAGYVNYEALKRSIGL